MIHGSHSPGQQFSLSLVEAKDGWSRFPLSKAGQLVQQGHKESPSPPVPAKSNILYIRGRFVDIVSWTVG